MHDLLGSISDLPELAAAADGEQDAPKSEITLMRLGRFRHPKFGLWHITRDTFDAFLANFASAGRVPIDIDHGPEKGGSSEAAGWITGLRVDGDELRADVEWTNIGAEAIRSKRYLFISPTWSWAGQDERGNKVGAKLVGAGMTNRPFFPFPALNLSTQVASDSLSFPLENERDDAIVDRMSGVLDFETHFADAVAHGIDPECRYLYRAVWDRNPDLHAFPDQIVATGLRLQHKWWARTRRILADPAEPRDSAPVTANFDPPPGLDSEGRQLHGSIVAYAAEHQLADFWAAAAVVTGDVELASRQQPPLRQTELAEGDAELAEFYRRANALAASLAIALADAVVIAELDDKIDAAQAEDGYDEVAWRDTSRPLGPQPWRDDDFERDLRRARTIDLELPRELWEAAADEGRDLVFEEAAGGRAERLAQLLTRRDEELAAARAGEAARRKQVIDGELRRRARRRLGEGPWGWCGHAR